MSNAFTKLPQDTLNAAVAGLLDRQHHDEALVLPHLLDRHFLAIQVGYMDKIVFT